MWSRPVKQRSCVQTIGEILETGMQYLIHDTLEFLPSTWLMNQPSIWTSKLPIISFLSFTFLFSFLSVNSSFFLLVSSCIHPWDSCVFFGVFFLSTPVASGLFTGKISGSQHQISRLLGYTRQADTFPVRQLHIKDSAWAALARRAESWGARGTGCSWRCVYVSDFISSLETSLINLLCKNNEKQIRTNRPGPRVLLN